MGKDKSKIKAEKTVKKTGKGKGKKPQHTVDVVDGETSVVDTSPVIIEAKSQSDFLWGSLIDNTGSGFDFLDDEEKNNDFVAYHEARILLNILMAMQPKSRKAYEFAHSVEGFLREQKIFLKGADPENPNDTSAFKYLADKSKAKYKEVQPEDWQYFREFFTDMMEKKKGALLDAPLAINTKLLIDMFGLKPHAAHAFEFMAVFSESHLLRDYIEDIIDNNWTHLGKFLAQISPELSKDDKAKLTNIFSYRSELLMKGIIAPGGMEEFGDEDEEKSFEKYPPNVPADLMEMLAVKDLTPEELSLFIVGEPMVSSQLGIEHFPHLQDHVDMILDMLKGATEQHRAGVNILLYGPAGSGKTALAAALAQALNLKMYTVGEDSPSSDSDENSSRPRRYNNGAETAKYRLSKLQRAHEMLKDDPSSIVFFDEMEDTLNKGTDSDKKADTFSKILLNRLLEKNPVPTIWAANDVQKFHESVRQRFMYSIEVIQPPTLMREKIWRTQMTLNGIELDQSNVRQLAREYAAAPRMIAMALGLAKLTGRQDMDTVVRSIRQASLITHGHEDSLRMNSGLSRFYNRDLVRSSVREPIEAWLNGEGKAAPHAVFLKSIPGAGATALAEDIAETLLMHPAPVEAQGLATDSPMISAEDKIKNMFLDAVRGNEFLIIHGIEHFHSSEGRSGGEWDRRLVSVFRRAALEHPLPFLITSWKDNLDITPDLKQIFTLTGQLSYLTDDQKTIAARTYFGRDWVGNENVKLLPGDFSAARKVAVKKNELDGITDEGIVGLVQAQAQIRTEGKAPIGFAIRDMK